MSKRKKGSLPPFAPLIRTTLASPAWKQLSFSFRDWAAERTNYLNHVVEMALAHAVADKVEAAYRRGDLLKKRFALAEAWAKFCASPPVTSEGVVALRERARA
jgi:hypothetical protein